MANNENGGFLMYPVSSSMANLIKEEDRDDGKLYIIGKNKTTHWNFRPSRMCVRRPAQNIVVVQPVEKVWQRMQKPLRNLNYFFNENCYMKRLP